MSDPIANIEAMQAVYLGDSVKAVMQERVEQITKHGYDAESDNHHSCCELADAAQAVLFTYRDEDDENEDGMKMWPWRDDDRYYDQSKIFHHIAEKTPLEKLAVAAALILAEMDRLDRIEKENDAA